MAEDTPHYHESGYMPILDTEMCVINDKFSHRHFSKPMSSTEVARTESAMSLGAKLYTKYINSGGIPYTKKL